MREAASTLDQIAAGWRGYALVALVALAAALFGLGRMPVLDGDEARFALAARQAAEAQGAGAVAAIHQVQAAAAKAALPMTERLTVIWPYRLPSVLGLLLASAATLWGGTVLVGRRAAFLGAGFLAAGFLAGVAGMSAHADALVLGWVTLALAALARVRAPEMQRRAKAHALIFWAALAVAFVLGGAMPLAVAVLTIGALAAWERRGDWLAPLAWWPAPALGLAITFLGAAAFAPPPPTGTNAPFDLPGYQLFLLPFLIFPATFALPAAARLAWEAGRAPRSDAAHANGRFLLAWALPTLLLFELLPSALPALPAYPAIALLCGAGLIAMRGRQWRTVQPAGFVLFGVAGLVIVALTAAAATLMPGDLATDLRRAVSAALIGCGVVGVALAALLMLRGPAARASVLIVCALALSFSLRERLLPEGRELHVSSEAAAALTRARLTPRADRPLWVIGYSAPSLMFMTRTNARMAQPGDAAANAQPGDAMIVEGRRMREIEQALAARGLVFTPAEPAVRGLSLAHGDRVALFVGRVEPLSGAAAGAPPQNP